MAAPSSSALIPILPPAPHEPVKQALILRLSEDSINALRELVSSGLLDKPGQPVVEIELDEAGSPSLHVPTAPAPFSLSSTKLSPPLELLSQRARLPSAPLHLSALVHTRYSIRQTNVSQSAKDRLREGKEREEREKRGRKIIQLESDPSKTKGKGKATSSVGGSRAGTPVGRSTSKGDLLHPPGTASTSSSSRQASKSPAPPGAKEGTKTAGGIPLRTRILQLLALGPLSSKQIASRVRANEGEVSRILDEVARPTGYNPSLLRLLPQSYLQLEIFSWPQYSSIDKRTVIAACEEAFSELGLPKDAEERRMVDPEWKGGSPLKKSVSSNGHNKRDSSTGSNRPPEKKLKREASPRPPPKSTKASSSSDESDEEVALSIKKRKGSKSDAVPSKEKRRRTTAPDDMPSASTSQTKPESSESKPRVHRPPASPLPTIASAPTPPASLPPHVKAGGVEIASSPAGTPLSTIGLSPPADHKKPATTKDKSRAKSKRNATPEFTSSEDEGPSKPARARSEEEDDDRGSTSTRSPSPPLPPLNLPSNHKDLRKHFKVLFAEYERLNVVLEKERIEGEEYLAGMRKEEGRSYQAVKRDARRRNELHRDLEEIKRRLR